MMVRRLAFYRFSSIHRFFNLILFLAIIIFVYHFNSKGVRSNYDAPDTTPLLTYSNLSNEVDEQVLLLLKRGLISKNSGSLAIQPIFKPSVFGENLPHLFDFDNVNPKIHLAAPTGFFRSPPMLILAIPTVKRVVTDYYKNTIINLMNSLQDYEFHHVLFLIYIADFPHNEGYKQEIVDWLKESYPKAVEQGLFEVVGAPSHYFPPNLNQTTPTFKDSPERMYWRTKQNLDFAYMMLYARLAHPNSNFYIQLEDDIIATKGFVTHILNTIYSNPTFFSYEFSQLGFIGKLFRVQDLHFLIDAILMFHKDKPVDLVLGDLFASRFCTSGSKHCSKEINKSHRFIRRPALFQHIGRYSSLRNKEQRLREVKFERGTMLNFEEHVVNNYNGVQMATNPDLKLNSEELAKFFKHGLPLKFDNPPDMLEFLIKFEEPIQIKEIELRFAAQCKNSTSLADLPLTVEFMEADSTTGYQKLNSTSKYMFRYTGQIWISNLRVTCRQSFAYLIYTLFLLR